MKWNCLVGAGLTALMAGVGQAQLTVPTIDQFGTVDSTMPVSAMQAQQNLFQLSKQAEYVHPSQLTYGALDSVSITRRARALRWLAWLKEKGTVSVSGIQTLPYADVLVAADDDSAAQAVLKVRLASKSLSPADRAYTLCRAVEAFADAKSPRRLAIAERYLRQLDALGPLAATRRFQAETALVDAYDAAGQSDEVARHGSALVRLLPVMPQNDRHVSFIFDGQESIYPAIARAFVSLPHGRDSIATLNTVLTASTRAPMDSVALDQSFLYTARGDSAGLSGILQAISLIGETERPLYSNRWWNISDSSAHAMRVDDGKIRIVEVGHYTCPPCILGATGLQRIADAHPEIQTILVTHTEGSWGNRVLTPDTEATFLSNFWLNDRHIRYPIAMWLTKRVRTPYGDYQTDLSDDSTLTVQYPLAGKPQFYVLDGQGRIRATFFAYSRLIERQLAQIVEHLERENSSLKTAAATP